MPMGDRTGPNGQGPGTGRQLGFCQGYSYPGYSSCGRGYGRRNVQGVKTGRNGNFRNSFWSRQRLYWNNMGIINEEKQSLLQDKKVVDQEIDFLKARLNQLELQKKRLEKWGEEPDPN